MAMMNCPECGKEISELAENCPNCGFPIGFGGGKATQSNQQDYKQYQQNNAYQQNTAAQPIKAYIHESKKNSVLGVIALILSIFGITFIISAILAVIDLCKKDGKKKIFSCIALCISGFWLLVFVIGGSDSFKEGMAAADTKQEIQSETPSEKPKAKNEKINTDSEKVNSSEKNDVEQKVDKKEEKEQSITREDFISSCEEIPYKTLARNPEENIGKHIKLTVKVTQILQGGIFDNGEYYRVYTNDEYGIWLGDEYFMFDEREDKSVKILQDDILTVYAECAGTTQVKRALTNTKEDVVSIKAFYIDLIEDENYSGQTEAELNSSEDDGLSMGQRNALNQATSYLEWSAFSYQGLIGQLEYEEYSHEDAVFAADHCGADWNEQAVKKATSYGSSGVIVGKKYPQPQYLC